MHSYRRDIVGYQVGDVAYTLKDDAIYCNGKRYCPTEAIALAGQHNYLNACAALALVHDIRLHDMQLDAGRVVTALGSFAGLAHRMETACIDNKGAAG